VSVSCPQTGIGRRRIDRGRHGGAQVTRGPELREGSSSGAQVAAAAAGSGAHRRDRLGKPEEF